MSIHELLKITKYKIRRNVCWFDSATVVEFSQFLISPFVVCRFVTSSLRHFVSSSLRHFASSPLCFLFYFKMNFVLFASPLAQCSFIVWTVCQWRSFSLFIQIEYWMHLIIRTVWARQVQSVYSRVDSSKDYYQKRSKIWCCCCWSCVVGVALWLLI